jgi:nitrate reductase NapAB chaperone NapD
MAEGEYHVASFVVSTKPEHADQVTEVINSMSGLEVHAGQSGKLVVTAEAKNVRELADVMGTLEQLDSVIAVAPVYHEYAGAEQ